MKSPHLSSSGRDGSPLRMHASVGSPTDTLSWTGLAPDRSFKPNMRVQS
ncbi:hypothetical protein OAG07_00570 [Verrucomicrobia bacterium]|nr:hypothetical protein [Verrucomicrobiota bacterium]